MLVVVGGVGRERERRTCLSFLPATLPETESSDLAPPASPPPLSRSSSETGSLERDQVGEAGVLSSRLPASPGGTSSVGEASSDLAAAWSGWGEGESTGDEGVAVALSPGSETATSVAGQLVVEDEPPGEEGVAAAGAAVAVSVLMSVEGE